MALVCADEELLAAEFEAIIAAGWSPPTAVPQGGGTGRPAVACPPDFVCRGCRPSLRPSRLPGRQRSPPGRRWKGARDVKEVGVEGSRVCRVPGCIPATRGLVMPGSG